MQSSNASRKSGVRAAVLSVAVVLAAVSVLVGWFVCFPVFVMPSASMEKTLLVGDHIVVNRIGTLLGRQPQRGDVIAFHHPANPREDYVKRIVGIPGDRLRMRDKRLFRNGVEVQEPYVQHITSFIDAYRDNFPDGRDSGWHGPGSEAAAEMAAHHVRDGELVVPAGKYFVLGDNRDDSLDSRYWGFIQRSDMIGRPIRIYASSDASRIGKTVK
jgi:signal peptidase I